MYMDSVERFRKTVGELELDLDERDSILLAHLLYYPHSGAEEAMKVFEKHKDVSGIYAFLSEIESRMNSYSSSLHKDENDFGWNNGYHYSFPHHCESHDKVRHLAVEVYLGLTLRDVHRAKLFPLIRECRFSEYDVIETAGSTLYNYITQKRFRAAKRIFKFITGIEPGTTIAGRYDSAVEFFTEAYVLRLVDNYNRSEHTKMLKQKESKSSRY